MSTGKTYVGKIKSIDDAMKRLNAQIKTLRIEKKNTEQNLYKWMQRHQLETYETYSTNKLAPKPKMKRKKESEKKQEASQIFTEMGIADVETAYKQVKNIFSSKKPVEENAMES